MYSYPIDTGFELLSSAFKQGEKIPVQYTCKGQNINPPLSIVKPPGQTKSFVLVMHDPDAVNGDFLHWLMWDIPAASNSIRTNSVPVGAVQGPNGAGANEYLGPCPPKGTKTHRYIFELYALDASLGMDAKSTLQDIKSSMQTHIIAQTRLLGIVEAD